MRILAFLLLFVAGTAYAGNPHHHNCCLVVDQPSETKVLNITDSYSDGTAAAMAMDGISFDTNTSGLQIGVGGGWYEDKKGRDHYGAAVGIASQIQLNDKTKGLINGKFTIEDGGGRGANAGFTWKF